MMSTRERSQRSIIRVSQPWPRDWRFDRHLAEKRPPRMRLIATTSSRARGVDFSSGDAMYHDRSMSMAQTH